jgi:hypothetical protein
VSAAPLCREHSGVSTTHLAAFIAGSSLVTIVAVTLFVRSTGVSIPAGREDALRTVKAVETMVMAALLVVFVAGAFAGR